MPGVGGASRPVLSFYKGRSTTIWWREGAWLAQRPEVDGSRTGVIGYSMGGWQVFPLAAAVPTERRGYDPVAPHLYGAGIRQPFLIQLGREDEMVTAQGGEQLCGLLASPAKPLRWYDGGHSLPVAYVPDAVAWLEEYLGTAD